MRRIASAVIVLAVAGSLVVGGATSATAAPVGTAVEWPEFEPSKSKPKAFMLNILGSVLGGAMPNSWKAEQLANAHKYNHSWEQMGAQFGTNPANPNYMGAPNTYDDYMIKKAEMNLKGGANGKPMTAPATKGQKLYKLVGGVLVAVTGFEFITSIGNGFMDLIGFDVENTMCVDDEKDGGLWSMLTGADCEAWRMTQEAMAAANADISERGPGWLNTVLDNGSITAEVIGPWVDGNVIRFEARGMYVNPALAGTSIQSAVSGRFWCMNNAGDEWKSVSPTDAGIWVHDGTTTQFLTPSVFRDGGQYGTGTITCPTSHPVPYSLTRATSMLPVGSVWSPGTGDPERGPDAFSAFFLSGTPTWFSEGSPSWVPGVDANPPRVLECSITGDDGNTYTAISDSYTEGSGSVSAPVCPTLPDGVTPINTKYGDDKGNEMWDQDVTDEWLDWWTTYPECRTGACKLDLVLKGGSTAVSCFDLEEQCVDWFEDPDKLDKYECIYGIHTVALSECNVYAVVFKPGQISIGAPYSDPMTGEWSGGTNAPSPDRQALMQDVQDPAGPRSCNGLASAGFDPVAWVMRPIQCALEWAFVPRAAVAELAGAQLAAEFETRAPGQLIGMVGAWEIAPVMSGCSKTVNWSPNTFDDGPEPEMVLWDMCPGSELEFLGTMSKIVTTLGFGVLVFLAVRRYVSGMVDYR